MNARIAIFLEEANEENLDKQTTWEFLKATIRTECINYGTEKSQLKYMKGESELENKVNTLSTQLAQSPNDEKLLHKYEHYKKELDIKKLNKTRGEIIRAKVKWIEVGEKNT